MKPPADAAASASGGQALRIVGSLAIIAAAVWLLDWRALAAAAAALSWESLAVTAALSVVTLGLLTLRWCLMARRVVPAPLGRHARQFWTAGAASLFTPAAIGADLYRIAALRRSAGGVAVVAGLILRERLIGLTGYALFYLPWWLASSDRFDLTNPFSLTGGVLAPAGLGLIVILTAGGRLTTALARRAPVRLQEPLRALALGLSASSFRQAAVSLALTLAACGTWAAAAAAMLAGAGAPLPFAAASMVATTAELARWLPISLQGAGVREAVFAFGAERFSASAVAGFLAGGALYLIHMAVILLAAGAAALSSGERPQADAAPPND